MAVIKDFVVTNAGREMQAHTLLGEPIVFVRAAVSDVSPGDELAMKRLRALPGERRDAVLLAPRYLGDGEVLAAVNIDNGGNAEAFPIRGVGLYVRGRDGAPVLFAAVSMPDHPDVLPAQGEQVVEYQYRLTFAQSEATPVAFIPAAARELARQAFEEQRDEFDASMGALGARVDGVDDNMERVAASVAASLADYDERIAAANERITGTEQEIAAANEAIEDIRQATTETAQALADVDERVTAVEGQVREDREGIAALSAAQDDLETSIGEQASALEALAASVRAVEERAAGVEDALATVDAKIEGSIGDLERAMAGRFDAVAQLAMKTARHTFGLEEAVDVLDHTAIKEVNGVKRPEYTPPERDYWGELWPDQEQEG